MESGDDASIPRCIHGSSAPLGALKQFSIANEDHLHTTNRSHCNMVISTLFCISVASQTVEIRLITSLLPNSTSRLNS